MNASMWMGLPANVYSTGTQLLLYIPDSKVGTLTDDQSVFQNGQCRAENSGTTLFHASRPPVVLDNLFKFPLTLR